MSDERTVEVVEGEAIALGEEVVVEQEITEALGPPEESREEARQAVMELEQARQRISELEGQMSLAVAKYREAVLRSLPDVPPELVQGATVEEVEESLVAARRTVEAVRKQLAERALRERVPLGAPPRGQPDLSALSPKEKIALALSRSQG
jgi:hypothetical protein